MPGGCPLGVLPKAAVQDIAAASWLQLQAEVSGCGQLLSLFLPPSQSPRRLTPSLWWMVCHSLAMEPFRWPALHPMGKYTVLTGNFHALVRLGVPPPSMTLWALLVLLHWLSWTTTSQGKCLGYTTPDYSSVVVSSQSGPNCKYSQI